MAAKLHFLEKSLMPFLGGKRMGIGIVDIDPVRNKDSRSDLGFFKCPDSCRGSDIGIIANL